MNETFKSIITNSSLTDMIKQNFKTKVANVVIDHCIEKATKLFLREVTVSLSFRNFSNGVEIYNGFLTWLSKNNKSGNTSLESVLDYHGPDEIYDIGDKPVYFKYMNHHFIAYKKQGEAFSTIVVTMLGRNVNIMKSFYNECRKHINYGLIEADENSDRGYITVYSSGRKGSWEYIGSVPERNLDTVIIDRDIKDDIFNKITEWKSSEKWYKDRGIPYKLSMLLYGPPGTGKTSMIKAIASKLGYNVYMLDISGYNDQSLLNAIRGVENNSIIVFEDFDAVNVTKSRNAALKAKDKFFNKHKNNKNKIKSSKITNYYDDDYDDYDDYDDDEYPKDEHEDKETKVTFNGLLNILDGIVPLDNKIIIFTTNVIEKLDAAMLRHGRVDFQYYIGELQDKEVREYITMMFPEANISEEYRFLPILGCDIQALFFDNKYDVDKFIESIPKE